MPADTSDKNMLIVIHGMGEHTGEGVIAEVERSLAAKLGSSFGDKVDIRAIAYNKIFNDWRKRAAQDWSETVGALEGRVHFSKVKSWLESAAEIDDDNFFKTHWLDVLLYMSTLGVRVQLEVARQLTQILQEFNNGGNLHSRKIVLLAHSLGTAVAHDTLHKMWQGGFEDDRYNNLSRLPFSFTAFYQLAITSRLLKTGIDPTSRNTAVRPAPSGMMERMYNIHHKYDPISLVKQFEIHNLDRWLPEQDWPDEVFFDEELKGVHEVNVHSMSHYLSAPQVYCNLFNELLDDYSFPDDYSDLVKRHDKGKAGDKIKEFKAEIEAASLEKVESISEIVRFWKAVSEVQTRTGAKIEEVTAALRNILQELDIGGR